jgi:hypothetical protein
LKPLTRCGQAFLKSITASDAFKDIGDEMKLMAPTMDLESLEACKDVVVRSIVRNFWKACIDKCSETTTKYRVCAVGTPGIGKTATTPVLLRLLLQQGATIVYHCRAEEMGDGVMFEFVPCGIDLNRARVYHCFGYEEPRHLKEVANLHSPSTFYIVDPGKSTISCNPPGRFAPKVIIVSSPDEKHWGGSGFLKKNNGRMGVFLYYPLWTLQELLQARRALNARFPEAELSKNELHIRFAKVGGVPRTLFLRVNEFPVALRMQDHALDALLEHRLNELVFNSKAPKGFDSHQARSPLLGYQQTDDETFETESVGIVSSLARAKIYDRYRDKIWNIFCTSSGATRLHDPANGRGGAQL